MNHWLHSRDRRILRNWVLEELRWPKDIDDDQIDIAIDLAKRFFYDYHDEPIYDLIEEGIILTSRWMLASIRSKFSGSSCVERAALDEWKIRVSQ